MLFLIITLFFTLSGKQIDAQILNGAYARNDIVQKKPMALPSVREADVFWSKKVWRIIDLREKMNLPLYYPTQEMDGRENLITLLLDGISTNQITPYADDDFKTPMSYQQVQVNFNAQPQTVSHLDFDTGETITDTIEGKINKDEIKQYMLKEEWYFDKQSSTLNVRIIGIAPIRLYVRENDPTRETQRSQVFWIYYPDIRNLLATHLAINPNNDASQMSFDDIFIKRIFNSFITKESNVYNNRFISDYLSGKEAMLESKRIENEIFNFEQDLWEY